MSDIRPFSIRIFVTDGRPDGLRIIDRSNWTGRGLVFPRSLLPEIKQREEFGNTGVYVLIGPSDEGGMPMIYIGEGDPVRPRLESHYANKDFWTWAVFFIAKDNTLNKAHVQHLEARLIRLANEANRANLDNSNTPSLPTLSEAEIADVETYLSYMQSIFPLIGLTAFEKPQAPKKKRQLLYLEAKGIKASGYESTQGFVVQEGSLVVSSEVPSIHRYLTELRKQLIERGIFVVDGERYRMTQDFIFNSPSTAAGVVLGRSANGRVEWHNAAGRTLKSLQEEAAGEPN